MDLYSRYPESNTQGKLISKINDEKLEAIEFDLIDSNQENMSQNNYKFENLQKVNTLRKCNIFFVIFLTTLIILFSYFINHHLINLSLNLINNFTIKDKSVQIIFSYVNYIFISASFVFIIILYLNYPLNYSFTYILSLIVSEYASSLIYILYGIDREKEKDLQAFFENGSEKPNIQLIKIVNIYYGFWRLLKSKGRNKKEINRYKKINGIIFLISFFVTLIIFLEQVFVEKCSIKSCSVGLFWGFIFYTFIYERLCIQFMKANFFMNYINSNYWLFIFSSIIPLIIMIYMFNNYMGIDDIFEIYNYIPFYGINNITQISQDDMNRICLRKSLIVFLLIFIVHGIKSNYEFVTSKNNNYNLIDIVLFNQTAKIKSIIRSTFIYLILGIALIVMKEYINYYYKLVFIYYLFGEIFIYFIFAEGLFGKGIKDMLKPNVNEERELEDYQDLGFSEGSTPQNGNEEGRI